MWRGGGTTRQRSGQSSPKTSRTSSSKGGKISKRTNKKAVQNRVSFTEGKEELPKHKRVEYKQGYLFLGARVGFFLKMTVGNAPRLESHEHCQLAIRYFVFLL